MVELSVDLVLDFPQGTRVRFEGRHRSTHCLVSVLQVEHLLERLFLFFFLFLLELLVFHGRFDSQRHRRRLDRLLDSLFRRRMNIGQIKELTIGLVLDLPRLTRVRLRLVFVVGVNVVAVAAWSQEMLQVARRYARLQHAAYEHSTLRGCFLQHTATTTATTNNMKTINVEFRTEEKQMSSTFARNCQHSREQPATQEQQHTRNEYSFRSMKI